MNKKVMIIAGEASGDMHGAQLVSQVHKLDADIQFFGIGGSHMRKAGVDVRVDVAQLAVVGLIEVLIHYREIVTYLKQMQIFLKSEQPDLVVLIDYPEFNLRLAKSAKLLGIKVLFYISPQVWAWRQGRVKTIAKRVDMMAVIFEFEKKFYDDHHVPVRFVGHPLTDEITSEFNKSQVIDSLGLDPQRKIIGLMPGSRKSEIKRLLPIIVNTANKLAAHDPSLQFILPIASTLSENEITPYFDDCKLDVRFFTNKNTEVMQASDAVITASGTATLELALTGTPMVIIYRMAFISYHILRHMVHLDHIGLCNIVAGERVAPELIQYDATAEKISLEIEKIINDDNYAENYRKKLKRVRNNLGVSGNGLLIAKLTLEMLNP